MAGGPEGFDDGAELREALLDFESAVGGIAAIPDSPEGINDTPPLKEGQ